jgi:hypothetical protein
MVVTAALCADQVVVAAPVGRPEPAEFGNIAQRLVGRLAQNFRRVIPATRCWAMRRSGNVESTLLPAPIWTAGLSGDHRPISPFQFRLPPPIA